MPGNDSSEDPQLSPAAREVFTVSRLNREARAILEGSFPLLWVEGELSNLARPASGHWYFSLKDAQCQVRCAMFRTRNSMLGFRPENGQHVLLRARVSLYEGRGEFQLIVEHMEPAGDGALRLAFEQLKQKLAAEGLFDEAHKKPIPPMPRRVGVITSPTGAALRDVLSILRRRAPFIEVIVYPVPVQGEGAAAIIARMIALADARGECDVLILTRGGGSLEDLWAFNEEVVVRAIHACRRPMVAGVGHEIDVSIADFAADRRAPTPSAGAELVSPDGQALMQALAAAARRLARIMEGRLQRARERLDWSRARLLHPGRRLQDRSQRLDDLQQRLLLALRARRHAGAARLLELTGRLARHNPVHRIAALEARRQQLGLRLSAALRARLAAQHSGLATLARALDGVSPLATLERGYAIVTRQPEGIIVRDSASLRPGDRVRARFARGRADCTVDDIEVEP